MVEIRTFGKLTNGTVVTMYTISNSKGEYVSVLDYGAAIHEVCVSDAFGQKSNVVLNVMQAEELEGFSSEAVTIGRVANRIKDGRYIQNGVCVQLEKNYKKTHFIHGGSGNYAHRTFCVDSIGKSSIRMSLREEGEGGFPCGALMSVSFSFDDSSALMIRYSIVPDEDTVFSPTNHAYWNLSGGNAGEQLLKINASFYAPRTEAEMPEGGILPVEGTPMDFRSSISVLQAILSADEGFFPKQPPRFDDNYIIDGTGLRCAATLYAADTGRTMEVFSDMPAMVLFTAPGSEPNTYKAVCLETQFVSNAVNHSVYRQPFCNRGEETSYTTVYKFGCK